MHGQSACDVRSVVLPSTLFCETIAMKQEHSRPGCLPPTLCKAETPVDSLTELRQWMRDTEEFGVPHLGEFGFRIQCYRNRLATEFRNEETRHRIKGDFAKHAECQQELNQLTAQHGLFLDELESLAVKLQRDRPPFETWNEATRQFAKIQLEIDRHKGRERQLIEAMGAAEST